MHSVEPKVHLIAFTQVAEGGLAGYLDDLGVEWNSDAPSPVEEIIEVMSRGCYMSFGTDLNPNITRVREGNKEHLRNVIESGHGSVLEHAWVSFMLTDVSRVLTHELVRHRAGTAISQESLRYVRLDDLGQWIPSCFSDSPVAVQIFQRIWGQAEVAYSELLRAAARKEGVLSFDDLSFDKKKEYTSAARRVAPIGLATKIGWSCNMRALRHVIEERTAQGAEEEIRLVFGKIAEMVIEIYPNLFGDFIKSNDPIPTYSTLNRKV